MVGQDTESIGGAAESNTQAGPKDGLNEAARIWIMVDHSSREAAFESVASHLAQSGVETQIVTITDVLGSVAREAIAGGAERLLRGLRVATKGRVADEDFINAVRRGRPDILAVTNARYVRALGLLESVTGITSLQVGVLPNYDLSGAWLQSSLQAFIVPHAEHKERLEKAGTPSERILVAGPAIQPAFAEPLDRDQVRAEMGLADEVVVLVRANGFDGSTLEKIVFQATLVDRKVRFVFHHDGDAGAASALRRAADQYRLPASMFGKVAALERYFAASDMVIAAPDEPYLSEFIALDRPLLLVGSGESHAAQVEFLKRHGAARGVADALRLGSEIDRMTEPETLSTMAAAAAQISGNTGSKQVADALQVALAHAQEWRIPGPAPETTTEDQGAPGPETAQEEATVAGPFENIGTGSSTRDEDRPGEQPGATREPDYAGLSQAEAKQQLAELILVERDLERRLAELERQQQRWRNRLELAREWNETDLGQEAESVLRGYLQEATPLQTELADVRRQKEKLKAAARPASAGPGESFQRDGGAVHNDRSPDMERRFQKMEVDKDLKGLKDRIKRELGE